MGPPRDAGAWGDGAEPSCALLVQLVCADDLTVRPWRRYLAPAQRVVLGRGAAPDELDGELRIALVDPQVAVHHARLDDRSGAWMISDEGSAGGTWLDGRRLRVGEPAVLRDGALIEVGHTFLLFRPAAPCVEPAIGGEDPATLCPEWQLRLRSIDRLARSRHPVLIEGESGAGKELMARMLHERSGRRGALISLNCAALPDNLLEDELFGHVRGAFSGAQTSRDGLIRAADGGTLLLDEVGDMPPGLQVRLLRVLEDHKVRPLGSEIEIGVDVRIVAATHRDLAALVVSGTFRHDLLARLGLLPVRVPALRERREDLGLLIRALLAPPPNGLAQVRFEVEALRALLLYRWPLNVRELRSALLAAADLSRDEDGHALIDRCHLPVTLRSAASRPARAPRRLTAADQALREQLVQLLVVNRGNVAAVARALGNKRTNVQRLMARLGVDRSSPVELGADPRLDG